MNVIAVLEDESFIADNLDEMLRIKGYQVFFIEPLMATPEDLLLPKPDLLILDVWIGMRKLGLELAFSIKRIDQSIPILFITADASRATRELMDVFGQVLVKPFTINEFLSKVESLL